MKIIKINNSKNYSKIKTTYLNIFNHSHKIDIYTIVKAVNFSPNFIKIGLIKIILISLYVFFNLPFFFLNKAQQARC